MLHRKFIKVMENKMLNDSQNVYKTMENKMLNASQKVYKSNGKQNVKCFTESL